MDPSRIRLEDDRFGLIGAAFRPGNRAVYTGRRGDDHVWSIGIMVGPEDDIQTVEIDDHGAKSSRMLTSGERFEGLDILAAPGMESFIIAGTLTLMGMELSAGGQGTTHEFAEILRAAADDHSWRLPLRVVGHPRDLQLSAQGRDILRETAATLERDGTATTSLAAARRLELAEQALDAIRRRISRTSLQAYRMHGRWYVVLDNLARSRTTPSAVEEAPEAAEEPVAAEPAAETEAQPEPSGAPTEDDLAAFAEPEIAEPEVAAAELAEPEPPAEPSVEYVEEQPEEAAEEPLATAETEAPETTETAMETTAAAAGEAIEPEPEAVPEMEAVSSAPEMEEPVHVEAGTEEQVTMAEIEEPVHVEAGVEEPAITESRADEEYRAAATPSGFPSNIDEETAAFGAEMTEQATEASIEDLAITSSDEGEVAEALSVESEQPVQAEPLNGTEPLAVTKAEPEVEEAPSFEPEAAIEGTEEVAEPEPAPLAAEPGIGIEEPVVAEHLSPAEEKITEEPVTEAKEPLAAETATEEIEPEPVGLAEEPEAPVDIEPEMLLGEPASDVDLSALSEAETVTQESFAHVEEPASVDESVAMAAASQAPEAEGVAEPEQQAEPETVEAVQSEEALLFAEIAARESEEEPAATELEADVAEQSDQLIAEHIGEVPTESGAPTPEAAEVLVESETSKEEIGAAGEPSDEVIAEGIRTHVPAYADEIGRDELIDSTPAIEAPTEREESETAEAPEPEEVEAETTEAEPEPSGGPSAASYFADARGGAGARGSTPPHVPEADFATHLRGEVAFLRQQSREKDRQIGVWGDGAKWLQPFVDQIRSLEKQVERLGELHEQRENERISDLVAERDALRQRLEALEAKISASQSAPSAPSEPNRRSWFRRMMGSE